ncbi:hypothetical protein [Microvirga tunisiensis]|uniref:Uncharacterized protein n=1 Tax=Microvirga tunisiensis TaxID=2108360 RepID=A0A5N7MJA6_9HYPH|nr:hypothetical protein [Microvirga tunisiensis]MPR08929.1 hypothetical protein [Microvirga tunisiensis]MPR27141.1 hypothetical protein [Microvirga tunisiensis]
MPKMNNTGRAIPATLTFSQRESIRTLGVALRKLYKSYLKERPPEQFLTLIAKFNDVDRGSFSANDA